MRDHGDAPRRRSASPSARVALAAVLRPEQPRRRRSRRSAPRRTSTARRSYEAGLLVDRSVPTAPGDPGRRSLTDSGYADDAARARPERPAGQHGLRGHVPDPALAYRIAARTMTVALAEASPSTARSTRPARTSSRPMAATGPASTGAPDRGSAREQVWTGAAHAPIDGLGGRLRSTPRRPRPGGQSAIFAGVGGTDLRAAWPVVERPARRSRRSRSTPPTGTWSAWFRSRTRPTSTRTRTSPDRPSSDRLGSDGPVLPSPSADRRPTTAHGARTRWPRGRSGEERRRRVRRRPVAGLAAFLPLASRAPIYARLFLALVRDERMPAGAQGAAGRRGRLPGPRAGPHPGRHPDPRRARRPRRRRPRGRPVPRRRPRRRSSTRSSTSSGIDRARVRRDIAQIRRLTPGPVRRTIRRVPALVGVRRRCHEATGLGPRVRSWITQGGTASREGHPDQGRREARQERAR